LIRSSSIVMTLFSGLVYRPTWRLPLAGLVAFSHLQFSQIRGRQPYLIVRKILYVILYRAAAGAPLDFVMSVKAKRGNSTLIGFVVNENRMIVADKNGKAPSDADAYSAYCSDGMSDRGYSFSIHLIVDGNAYTGCCSTAALPPVGSD
jgi:hypothetical protein